jgi:hypothetical protein
MAKLKEIEAELEATGETPISLTDPDALDDHARFGHQ